MQQIVRTAGCKLLQLTALSCLKSFESILEYPPGDAGLSGVAGVSGLEAALEIEGSGDSDL
jgi:hypothetical protein